MGCIFCKIASGEIPSNKVYEDDFTVAFLDTNPASKGHTLVVPKEHFDNFTKVPRDILSHVFLVAQLVSQACIKELGASGVNVLTNVGESAGQTVMHFHVHVIPRYTDDMVKLSFSHKPLALPAEELPALADSIKKGIE